MKKSKNINISYIFTVYVVLLPVLGVIKSPIKGIDLGTCLCLLLSIFILKENKFRISKNLSVILLLAYIIVGTMFSFMLQGTINTMGILRATKLIVLVILILLVGYNRLFDYSFALKVLKLISISAVVFIVIQYSVYYMCGIVVTGGLEKIAVTDTYLLRDYEKLARTFYRPSSFFLEPAHFAQYLLLYLCYSIFGFDNSDKVFYNWKMTLLLIAGIVLSTSGLGIGLACLMVGIRFFQIITRRFSITTLKKLLVLSVALLFLSALLLQTDLVINTLNRVFTSNISGGGNAVSARTIGYQYYLDLPFIYKFIGMGYGNVPSGVYFNSLAYILYCCGFIGIIFLTAFFYVTYHNARGFQRKFLIIYFVLLFVADIFTPHWICFYFPFVLSKYQPQNINYDYLFEQS
jgi:hypothetical protein